MDVSMSEAEVSEFIASQKVMRLATADSKGTPHLTPMWYVYDGERIYFTADKGSKKLRNISANESVAVLFDAGTKLFKVKGILILGKARVIGDRENINKVRRLFAEKYFGSEAHEDFQKLDYYMKGQAFVEVVPRKNISWDYAKWRED